MTVETKQYRRKDIYVDEVQVTEENMEELAKWCQGKIRKTSEGSAYIFVQVIMPKTPKQSKAFVGDHILYTPSGYKVYTDHGFHKAFEPAPEFSDEEGFDPMDADTNGLGE